MRTFVRRLKQLWDTPVEFYGVDRPEPQAGPWHGLMLFVILLMVLGLLWLIRYLPERTYLVQDWPDIVRGAHMATTDYVSHPLPYYHLSRKIPSRRSECDAWIAAHRRAEDMDRLDDATRRTPGATNVALTLRLTTGGRLSIYDVYRQS